MKLAFFGGSFNPPTLAHINILKTAKKTLQLDKAYFVPVGDTYKKQELVREKYRYEMLRKCCENEKDLFVEDIELNKKEKITAVQVFDLIKEKYYKIYDNVEIYFIMGADNFIKISEWEESDKLIKNYKYIIFTRDNINIKKQIEENELLQNNRKNFTILKIEQNAEFRSSIIRNLVKEKNYEKAKQYTKPEIIEYIKDNLLWRK